MKATPWKSVLLFLVASCAWAVVSPAEARGGGQASQLLGRKLESGQAVIWYLHHSGWAVKTRNHLLIFDYTEPPSPSSGRSLDSGSVDPSEISDQNVTVFVSHGHSDHNDPAILEWRGVVKKIRYVWGWEEGGAPEDLRFGRERRTFAADGLEILNVHHDFDGIPESAFLVKADGLTILHAGDHGHSRGMENPVFKENILFLAGQAPQLDIFFTPTFGGEMEVLRTLKPRAVFPMHEGGREQQHLKFAEKVKTLGLDVRVGAAGGRGDAFLYSKGTLTSLLPDRLVTMLRGDSFREADGAATRLLADRSTDTRTMALCGLAVLKAGRVREAEAIFNKVISRSPDDPEAHLGLGRIARIRNDLEAAISHLRRAAGSADFYEEALRHLWRSAWDRGAVSDLFEIRALAEERYGRESRPLPSWIVNGFSQVEGLAGQRLYRMEGRFEHLAVPLVKKEDGEIRMISFKLNGKGEYLFDIDSASPDFMTVSPLLAQELGLSMTGSPSSAVGVGTGSASVRFSVLDSVGLEGIAFRNVPVMVSDLHPFRGEKKGLIGTGLLKRFNATIDVRAGVMDLYPLDRPDLLDGRIDRSAVAVEVPLYIFDATTVEASLGGAPAALYILDTAAGTHLVDAVFFREHLKPKLDPAMIAPANITGSQGTQQVNRIEGLSIALGPLVFSDQIAAEFSMNVLNAIGARYTAGLLGNPVLWPYRVHMDFRAGRLILEKYPSPR